MNNLGVIPGHTAANSWTKTLTNRETTNIGLVSSVGVWYSSCTLIRRLLVQKSRSSHLFLHQTQTIWNTIGEIIWHNEEEDCRWQLFTQPTHGVKLFTIQCVQLKWTIHSVHGCLQVNCANTCLVCLLNTSTHYEVPDSCPQLKASNLNSFRIR